MVRDRLDLVFSIVGIFERVIVIVAVNDTSLLFWRFLRWHKFLFMIQVNIGSMELTANPNIQQIVEVCSDFEKRNKLIKHLDQISAENAKVLIFVATKRVADDITKYLRQDGWPALAIHGDKEQ